MSRPATFLGTVEDVSGATVRVKLADSTISGLSFTEGHVSRVGQVGAFVRIPLGFADLYGVITQVGASAVPPQIAESAPFGDRWLTIELVGEGQPSHGFGRGISQHPTIGDTVHLVTETDLNAIYGGPDNPEFVRIGHLASARSVSARVDINRLVARHSAVLGTTGSGKSTTVVSLVSSISDPNLFPSARVLIIDVHGEYGAALSDRATVFRSERVRDGMSHSLYVPYWAMTADELLPITLGQIPDSDRGAVIDRVMELKLAALERMPNAGITRDQLTVDTPIPFSIHQLWFDLHCEMRATHIERPGEPQSRKTWALEENEYGNPVQPGDVLGVVPPKFRPPKDAKGDPEKIRLSQSRLSISRAVDGLASKLRDPRFDFIFRPGPFSPDPDGAVCSDLDDLLKHWLGDTRPITVLDLAGIPPMIQEELISALLRIIYDALFWARNIPEGGLERPLLVVLEEAHTYLRSDMRASGAKLAVQRIAKEGRKYGVGMMLVSQRPSEVDPTILSQCGTLFAMRLSNSSDRQQVTGTASDHLEGLFSSLPVLRTGEVIVVGEAVNLPIRAVIELPGLTRRPDSVDPLVVMPGDEDRGYEGPGGWNQERDLSDYSEAVRLWRRQDSRPERVLRPNDGPSSTS